MFSMSHEFFKSAARGSVLGNESAKIDPEFALIPVT